MRPHANLPLALLIGLTAAASAEASIQAPPSLGAASDEQILIAIEQAERAIAKPNRTSATSSQATRPTPPHAPAEDNPLTKLTAHPNALDARDSGGGAGGNSSSTSGGGNPAVAMKANADSLNDNVLVVWQRRADWLAMPVPPGTSLLRPPQSL